MELAVVNDENSFDPTPKLKSSPVPISFLSFYSSLGESKCNFCGNEYSETILFYQQYCKDCLSKYISHITDSNIYLDVYIVTKNAQCDKHEVVRNEDFCTQNIREWCKSCSDILYFKQISNSHYMHTYKEFEKIERYCKLCGKLVYNEITSRTDFRLCSDCYKVYSGWIKSTLLKKLIPIISLPWWDNRGGCF